MSVIVLYHCTIINIQAFILFIFASIFLRVKIFFLRTLSIQLASYIACMIFVTLFHINIKQPFLFSRNKKLLIIDSHSKNFFLNG